MNFRESLFEKKKKVVNTRFKYYARGYTVLVLFLTIARFFLKHQTSRLNEFLKYRKIITELKTISQKTRRKTSASGAMSDGR